MHNIYNLPKRSQLLKLYINENVIQKEYHYMLPNNRINDGGFTPNQKINVFNFLSIILNKKIEVNDDDTINDLYNKSAIYYANKDFDDNYNYVDNCFEETDTLVKNMFDTDNVNFDNVYNLLDQHLYNYFL